MTTREPEWDDAERDKLTALEIYESEVCECGFHSSLTSDKSNHFTFDTSSCPVCAGAARWARIENENDKEAEDRLGENAPPGTPRPSDGRHTAVRIMTPDEVDERRSRQAKN